MGNIDENKPRIKAVRAERVTMIETELPSISYRYLVHISETKHKEMLLKYLYVPFWISLGGVLSLLAVFLALFGSWYLFSGFIFFIGFSSYTVYKSKKQLKKIRNELAASVSPPSLEQPKIEPEKEQK